MSDLARHIDALAGTAVLCVGDVMLDRFVYGTVDRISPEAPIPVLRIERETTMLGGAGNVAANLAALGCGARFVSVVGDDEAGGAVLRLLVERSLADDCHMVTERGRQTSVKSRFLAANQQLLRADSETVSAVIPASVEAVLAAARRNLSDVGSVILSDYGKGVLSDIVVSALIAAAHSAGRPVVVDPKSNDFNRYRGAAVITPNRRELALASRLATGSDDEVVAAARRVIETCGIEAVVATRSEQGMSVVTASGEVCHLAAEAREVFDVSGAGDTVVATLAAALGAGVPLVDAARIANLAGGIVVGKVGTAVVHPAELVASLHQQEWRSSEVKVSPVDAAVETVERWRRQGRRIGFTNGCFDLLHPGHVSLLAQARAACDRLVVGLNSDESVRRLKGERRPVQSEAARAAVLASLASVDLVTIFADDTPIALIRAFRPDVLVKGADYRADQVVGGDFVRSYGGRVALADLSPGFSTTATISRLTG
ncbi:MAG: D-glycero-beta-D-manno-heptose-7-phosphate kinase [Azospirillum sp.]|nr:D-glycero-beta-D-manno-heptose-7-phosphate kinase [Azospirillum sp.]